MSTHLVIPDSHAKPGVSNERYTWLGKLVLDRRPDVIVNIGDWADMPSLSSYDRGRRSFEGRRYANDIKAANDALNKFENPIHSYNIQQARNHKAQYKPRKISLQGNHEERIDRATQLSPELDGTISWRSIRFKEHGWSVHDFLHPVMVDGVMYSHYFTSGIKGLAIGGEHPAASLLKKQFVSCTVGHSHIADFAMRTRADGQRIMGLVCGCYFEHWEDYAGEANNLWWRGVVICHNVKDGCYDPEFISIDEVKRRYA